MRRLVARFVVLLVFSGCTPAVPRPPVSGGDRPVVAAAPEAYPSAAVVAAIAAALARPDRAVTLVRLGPWSGDADRFTFVATLETATADPAWTLREVAEGNIDMHTRGIELTRLAADPGDGTWPVELDAPPPVVHVSPAPDAP